MIPHWLAVTLAIAAVWFVISLPLSLLFGRWLQRTHNRYPLLRRRAGRAHTRR
jgi:hypothetical protein